MNWLHELGLIVVGLAGPAFGYFAALRKLDGQHKEIVEKIDQTQNMNQYQINASNNFNTKLEKLQQQCALLARQHNEMLRQIRYLVLKTGIEIPAAGGDD